MSVTITTLEGPSITLSLGDSVLGAQAMPTRFTQAGSIEADIGVALISLAAAGTMTLDDGAVDGERLFIRRTGAPITLVGNIEGVAAGQIFLASAIARESVLLMWSVVDATWLQLLTTYVPATAAAVMLTRVGGGLLTRTGVPILTRSQATSPAPIVSSAGGHSLLTRLGATVLTRAGNPVYTR